LNARKKLNTAHLYGSLFVAAILGALCESSLVFLVVAGGLIGGAMYAGHIRPTRR
jgi:hypothetical protein